jgi:hypothetical protein
VAQVHMAHFNRREERDCHIGLDMRGGWIVWLIILGVQVQLLKGRS